MIIVIKKEKYLQDVDNGGKMKKNKIILFDWGNIVESHMTGYSCYDAWDDLFKKCGYTGDDVILKEIGKYNICTISSISEFESVFNKISIDYNFNKTFNEFIKLYREIFDRIDYYRDVAKYEVSLKNRCYIGILSDLTLFDKERLDKQVGLSNYDYVFLSYELGIKKPDIRVFKTVQDRLPFKPSDILFIDDRIDNIESASKIGWNVLHTTGLELDKIKEVCEEFLKD